MNSRIRQFFKTSESDKDDWLIINPSPKDLNEIENRKCSTQTNCELPIKDKKKMKHHLKENKNDLDKNKTTNQSSFYVLMDNGKEFDQKNSIKVIIDCPNDKSNQMLLKCTNQNEKNGESKKDLNKAKQIDQNESIVQATVDILIENQDYQFDDQQKKQQKSVINNQQQQVEKHKTFPPKPLKMIKKRLKRPKEIISDNQLNTQLNSQKVNCSPQLNSNGKLNKQSFSNHLDDKSISKETTKNQRRRKNQSFENLNDRLEFISLTCASYKENKNEQLKPIYKSEDNLLSIVPKIPNYINKLNNRLNKIENGSNNDNQNSIQNHSSNNSQHLQSNNLQFYSQNPVYRSFESERIKENILNRIKSNKESHLYSNDLSIDELIARPRKCDLNSLRELKPRQFLVPKIEITSSENSKLTYVNLEFDQTNESNNNDENENNKNGLKNKKVNQNKKESKQKFSKSDDDDDGGRKIEYCKIDFMKTESLIKIREYRIKNHHS